MKLVVLDRDGVINEDSDAFIKNPGEWIPIPGSLEAIARLNFHGFRVVVATNQSGIARGLFSVEDLNAIHARMRREIDRVGGQVDGVLFCPHGPADGCDCRKPLPGLFRQIEERLGMPLQGVFAVGDSRRDLQAAEAVGALPILVRTGKGTRTLAADPGLCERIPCFPDLAAAVQYIIDTQSGGPSP